MEAEIVGVKSRLQSRAHISGLEFRAIDFTS